MNSKEKVEAAEKVIEFAKSLGFSRAHMAIWDPYDSEYPQESFEDMADEGPGGICEATIGIFLAESVKFELREPTEDSGVDEPEFIWDPKF